MSILTLGDLFFVDGGSLLSRAINFFQRLKSADWESTFSHVGLVLDCNGTIFHAAKKEICRENLFQVYPSMECAIVRPRASVSAIRSAVGEIMRYEGEVYPYFRLFLHLIGLARFIHWRNTMVCSELVARFLYYLGIRHRYWFGTTVDQLWDELCHHRDFDTVFQGNTADLRARVPFVGSEDC
ncbi:MAG: hypothetical protein QW835_00110 [Candidatus Hadarchaeum sp.]